MAKGGETVGAQWKKEERKCDDSGKQGYCTHLSVPAILTDCCRGAPPVHPGQLVSFNVRDSSGHVDHSCDAWGGREAKGLHNSRTDPFITAAMLLIPRLPLRSCRVRRDPTPSTSNRSANRVRALDSCFC